MAVILHVDDDKIWLDNVQREIKHIHRRGHRETVFLLPRVTLTEALCVIDGTDQKMAEYTEMGRKLDAVVLDLLMHGGRAEDVRTWAQKVRDMAKIPSAQWPSLSLGQLAKTLSESSLDELGEKCPAVPAGRLATKHGAKVVIFSHLLDDRLPLLPLREFDIETQRKLIMAACGASAYIVKTDDNWDAKLRDTLGRLLS